MKIAKESQGKIRLNWSITLAIDDLNEKIRQNKT
jgi:hypothetical protein